MLLNGAAREGVAHLRVWRPEALNRAAVTETGSAAEVTEPNGQIWTELTRRHGLPLMLLEHHPAPEPGEGATSAAAASRRRPG